MELKIFENCRSFLTRTIILKKLFSVFFKCVFVFIREFISRIHLKHTQTLDTRDKREYDRSKELSKGIFGHLSTVILGFIPRIHLMHTILDSRVKPENDNCMVESIVMSEYDNLITQCGRSMIEMLGVLAIIGVLSVGGIQGFSKAMEMYHWNKALREWDILVNTMVNYKSELHINNNPPEGESKLSLIPILKATGDLPDDMPTEENDSYLMDALGNRLRIYSHNTGYIGIGYFATKNNYTACRMFLTIGSRYYNIVDKIQIYTIDDNPAKKNNHFYGVKECTVGRQSQCLENLNVAKISNICRNNTVCTDAKTCRFLMYWF